MPKRASLLIASLFLLAARPAAFAQTPTLSMDQTAGFPGDEVTLRLVLQTSGVPVIGTESAFTYDRSKLSYVSSAAGSAASAAGKVVDPSVAGGVLQTLAVYATGGSWDAAIEDGDLALITFRIGAAVTPGSELTVTISGCKHTVAPATTQEATCGSNGIVGVTAVATRTLMVHSSNPASGVEITMGPPDRNGLGNGTTSFTRTYDDGTQVTLTAPASAGANAFSKWQKDGADQTGNPVVVAMGADHTLTAVYQPAAASPAISLGNAGGAAGTSVTLALGLATNGALPIATETTIGYDTSKLTYMSSVVGAAAAAAGKSVDPSVAGGVLQKVAVYATGDTWDTAIEDGDLARITLRIGAAVTPGSELIVTISGCKYTVAPATTHEAACGSNGSISVSTAATCPDADGDDYAVCTASCNPAPGQQCGDCNDGNAAVHPNTTEACNGIDDDCDTVSDNGQAALCDDGNVCTTDACGAAAGCTHANNALSCNDGNACTLNEACSGGSCGGGTARSCDDAQACTADVCDPVGGCATSVTNMDLGGFSADRVDGRDLVVLADAWNSCPGDPRYAPAANLDRVQALPGACIDGTDFHLFMISFGRSCS